MTDDQKDVVKFYSTCNLVVFIVVVTYFAYIVVKNVFALCVRNKYVIGDASALSFRDVKGHTAYIARVVRSELTTPVICVDLNVPTSYIDLVSGNAWASKLNDPKVSNH